MDVIAVDDAGYLLVLDAKGAPAVLNAANSNSAYIQEAYMAALLVQARVNQQ